MALSRLVFDLADADTRASTAHVGAILWDKVNNRLGVINTDQELLVHDAGILAALGGTLDVEIQNASIVVTATDLDIRALDFATDSVDVSGSAVSITGDVNVTQGTSPWVVGDGGGSLTVDAADLDIRDLTHASDSIRLGDGTDLVGTTTVGGDVGLDVNVLNVADIANPLANTAIAAVAETVGVAAAQILDGADELADRKHVWIYNNGNRDVYVGPTGVTTASGFPIPPDSYLHAQIGAAVDLFMISDAAGQNVRTLQAS